MTKEEQKLRREVEELRQKVNELEETLKAISSGEVDAIVVSTDDTKKIYTLEGPDQPYRVLVENIREGALTISESGTILYSNTRFASMILVQPEKVLGTSLLDHVCPTDRTVFESVLQSARYGPSRTQINLCRGAGSLPVFISMNPLTTDGGTRISVIVTDRKEDEDRIRLQSRMLDAVGDAVVAADTNNRIIYWNEAATKTYGWKAEDVVGRDLDIAVPEISREEAWKITEQLATGKTWSGEYMVQHRDGHLFPIFANDAPVFDDEGKLIAIIGASHDITERKRSEEEILRKNEDLSSLNEELTAIQEELRNNLDELVKSEQAFRASESRYRNIVETSQEGIAIGAVKGGFTFVNQRFADMLGYTREEMYGKKALDFMEEDQAAKVKSSIALLQKGKPLQEEYRFRRKDGSAVWTLASSSPLYDVDGKHIGNLVMHTDITDRKQVEEELQKTVDELKRSNQDLEQFAYIASHDLQEPLRNVTLFSQLFIRKYGDNLTSEGREYLDFVIEGSTRMSTLIHDLLDYSRVVTRGEPFIAVDMNDVVVDACTNLQTLIQESGASITYDHLPITNADPLQIRQVFQNLIDNALKYRGTGVPEVHISSVQKEDEWIFCVKDNGIGIAPEYHERIFQLFKRLHTRQKYSGTGIGLSLVKKIVDRHGGRVWVESEEGKGATFCFTLPAGV
ncbi:MAG: PAS domain S-box protein, partial [Methanomicrobiales archaeon]|nr:PAS domain S-box protein [Methanomicrobiales archaeon]